MVQLWQASGDPDLASPSQGSPSAVAGASPHAMAFLTILGTVVVKESLQPGLLPPTAPYTNLNHTSQHTSEGFGLQCAVVSLRVFPHP